MNLEYVLKATPIALILIIIIFIVLEVVILNRFEDIKKNELVDTYNSVFLGFVKVIIGLFTKSFTIGIYLFCYNHKLFTIDHSKWWVWGILFFGVDFSYYWSHRASHTIRWFWASHLTHHSSTKMNLLTSLKIGWTINVSGVAIFYFWIPLLGFDPIIMLLLLQIIFTYNYLLHTEAIKKMWKPIEYIFNTPSHHRVHHGSNLRYLDVNYGGALIIWDRIFGTYVEEGETPHYGLVKQVNSRNPFVLVFSEWVELTKDIFKARSFKHLIMYLFGAPGWLPDLNNEQRKGKKQ